MKKGNFLNNKFIKGVIKGAQGVFIGAAIAAAPMMATGCTPTTGTTTEQHGNEPVQNPEQNETFRTTTLGGADSGLEIFHWREQGMELNNPADMPQCVKKCGAYTMSKVNAFEKSLTPAQKQVWREIGGENWLNAIKQLNFTVDNIDQIYDTIYNGASDVMCTLTRALPVYPDADTSNSLYASIDELNKFVYTFEIITNETYKQSGDSHMTYSTDKAYNEKMNSIVKRLKYCDGMTTTDAKNDIQNNNCIQIVTVYDQQLTTASNTLGLNFSPKQRALFTNIITSAQGVRQINGYYSSTSAYQDTKYKPNFSLHAYNLDDNLEETTSTVYFNSKNQNSQMEQ